MKNYPKVYNMLNCPISNPKVEPYFNLNKYDNYMYIYINILKQT